MDNIDQVIGGDHALELSFNSRYRQLSAEDWSARLSLRLFDNTGDELDGELLAVARLVRVNLDENDWYDSLDAESGDLEAVAAAFVHRERVTELDEGSLFASNLTIVDHISVPPEHRGSKHSHALIRGIGHIFRNDIVALIPASMGTIKDGTFGFDEAKQAGLRRHWAGAGLILIPGTDVMLLPSEMR